MPNHNALWITTAALCAGTLGACTPDRPTAEGRVEQPPPDRAAVTATPEPTATAAAVPATESPGGPTQPPTPSASPTPGASRALDPAPPWLVGADEGQVVAVNPDGSGRTVLASPPLWDPQQDIVAGEGVSSAGWIAARTGMPNDWNTSTGWMSSRDTGPAQVGIAIWRLPGHEPVRVIPRFSEALQAAMGEIIEFETIYDERLTGPRWKFDPTYVALLLDDARLFWSPNGRYLAFAAALDGPSADVYLYDAQSDQIRRLTDGPNQAVVLGWSPDSRRVLHYESSSYRYSHGEIVGFPAEALWAAPVDGTASTRLGPTSLLAVRPAGWRSPDTVLLSGWSGGGPWNELWMLDIDTGARRVRQDLLHYHAAVHPRSGAIAVNADSLVDPAGGYLPGGLFVLSELAGELVEVGAGPAIISYGSPVEWVEQLGAFLTYQPYNFDNPVRPPFIFSPTGELLAGFPDEVSRPAVSPDGGWLAFAGDGVRVYDEAGQLRISLATPLAASPVWAADSAALYYLLRNDQSVELRVLALADERSELLHPDVGLEGLHLVSGDN